MHALSDYCLTGFRYTGNGRQLYGSFKKVSFSRDLNCNAPSTPGAECLAPADPNVFLGEVSDNWSTTKISSSKCGTEQIIVKTADL